MEYCSNRASVLSPPNVASLLANVRTVQVLGDLEGVHGGRQFSSSLIASNASASTRAISCCSSLESVELLSYKKAHTYAKLDSSRLHKTF